MQIIDTHCHIHDPEFSEKYDQTPDELIASARKAGVEQLICVGTDVKSSQQAVSFCKTRDNCYASVALHPHEAADMTEDEIDSDMKQLEELAADGSIVAIGECGLDYYYHDDEQTRQRQHYMLTQHIALAEKYQLPLIFHVRDQKLVKKGEKTAFDDFFSILDRSDTAGGVVHSFSSTPEVLERIISRGLYVGLNGIMTFSKDEKQLEAARLASVEQVILETDAPFLTPKPFRGKMCKPEHIVLTAEFLAELRGESLEEFARYTTRNAHKLFGI